jgi:hypothetical protein
MAQYIRHIQPEPPRNDAVVVVNTGCNLFLCHGTKHDRGKRWGDLYFWAAWGRSGKRIGYACLGTSHLLEEFIAATLAKSAGAMLYRVGCRRVLFVESVHRTIYR